MASLKISRRLLILIPVSVAAGVIASLAFFYYAPKPPPEISRQQLIEEVRAGYVHEVVITDGEILTAESSRSGPFLVRLRRDDHSLADELSAMGVTVKLETEPLGLI
jgi:FtsH-like protein